MNTNGIIIVYKILMNNTIVRRRADVCFSGNVIIEILTREVVFNLNCSEQINGKHTILTICPDSSVGLEQRPSKAWVVGSNPTRGTTMYGFISSTARM